MDGQGDVLLLQLIFEGALQVFQQLLEVHHLPLLWSGLYPAEFQQFSQQLGPGLDVGLNPLEPGDYSLKGRAVRWDGRDERGEPLPSGVYFCLLRVGGEPIGMRKALLLK